MKSADDGKVAAATKELDARGEEEEVRDSFFLASVGVFFSLTVLVAAILIGAKSSKKFQQALFDVVPTTAATFLEEKAGLEGNTQGFDKAIVFPEYPQDQLPEPPISFSVHFNGDGAGEGKTVSSKDFQGLDDFIRRSCTTMEQVRAIGKENPSSIKRICEPEQGAKLYNHNGRRIRSLKDLKDGERTYVVPQGIFFVWPMAKVGDIIHPDSVRSPIPDKPIRLRQLSMSPRVFTVENFMSQEEMSAILEHNKDLVRPSEVGFAGWRDSTRTSWTAWDYHSWAARKVQRRSFDLLGLDFDSELADATQVLRYSPGEWYKPHTDWFDEKAYDGHDPTVGNGTNRFATVFLYLTDVDEGGHTVFPLSTTHEGYNGEQLVHKGTENTPGYIAQKDAEWVCNTSSTALRSNPVAGNAVLFYSQGPDGSLDKYSLHGGCPVGKGIKWSANVWIWNRPKPDKDKAKDGKPEESDTQISMMFLNQYDRPVDLYWDDGTEEMVFQMTLETGAYQPMTTYHGHIFKAMLDGKLVHTFVARDDLRGKEHHEVIKPK